MKFEFSLPRNTKLKSLNMVINSNDRQHQTDKAKVTKRIRAFAYWHTSMNKDKGRVAFENGDEYYTHSSNVTLYNK